MNRTLYWFKAPVSAPGRPAAVRLLTILGSTAMPYQEYPPSPALRAHVACFWTSHAGGLARPHTQRVLPDNCVDILWQDGGRPGFAVGMMTSSIDVVTAGALRTVAVRFKPGAAGRFLALPLHTLSDTRADIDQLWGRGEVERLADGLWTHDLSDRARVDLLEHRLLECWRRSVDHWSGSALVQAALARIDGSGGDVRVASLADGLGVTRQHLAAQFRSHVGLTPKMVARICRFRRAIDALKSPSSRALDWAQLALACGYFDQSHLIHDFQEFAGAAPERFLSAR